MPPVGAGVRVQSVGCTVLVLFTAANIVNVSQFCGFSAVCGRLHLMLVVCGYCVSLWLCVCLQLFVSRSLCVSVRLFVSQQRSDSVQLHFVNESQPVAPTRMNVKRNNDYFDWSVKLYSYWTFQTNQTAVQSTANIKWSFFLLTKELWNEPLHKTQTIKSKEWRGVDTMRVCRLQKGIWRKQKGLRD